MRTCRQVLDGESRCVMPLHCPRPASPYGQPAGRVYGSTLAARLFLLEVVHDAGRPLHEGARGAATRRSGCAGDGGARDDRAGSRGWATRPSSGVVGSHTPVFPAQTRARATAFPCLAVGPIEPTLVVCTRATTTPGMWQDGCRGRARRLWPRLRSLLLGHVLPNLPLWSDQSAHWACARLLVGLHGVDCRVCDRVDRHPSCLWSNGPIRHQHE